MKKSSYLIVASALGLLSACSDGSPGSAKKENPQPTTCSARLVAAHDGVISAAKNIQKSEISASLKWLRPLKQNCTALVGQPDTCLVELETGYQILVSTEEVKEICAMNSYQIKAVQLPDPVYPGHEDSGDAAEAPAETQAPTPVPRLPQSDERVPTSSDHYGVTIKTRAGSHYRAISTNSADMVRKWCYSELTPQAPDGELIQARTFDLESAGRVSSLDYNPAYKDSFSKSVYSVCESIVDATVALGIPTDKWTLGVRGVVLNRGKVLYSFDYSATEDSASMYKCLEDSRYNFQNSAANLRVEVVFKNRDREVRTNMGGDPASRRDFCNWVVKPRYESGRAPTPAATPQPTPVPTPAEDQVDPYFQRACEAWNSTSNQVACFKETSKMKMKSAVVADTCMLWNSTDNKVKCLKENRDLEVRHPLVESVCASWNSTDNKVKCLQQFKDVKSLNPAIARTCMKWNSTNNKQNCLLNEAAEK